MESKDESSNASTNTIASFTTFCDVSLNERSHVSPEQKWPALSVPSESSSVSDPLIRRGSNTSPRLSLKQAKITTTISPVRWGVTKWQWSSMVLTTLAGIVLALLHHAYYTTLNNSLAGSSSRQQWSINIGTAFAFAVIAVLKTASSTAYHQYIWRTVKRKPINVEGLDNLFALTSNPFGFFDWELWNKAPLAVLLALLCWCLTLGGIAPPGALTVISNRAETTRTANVKTFNFDQSVPDYLGMSPNNPLQKLANDVATELSPSMGSELFANSSYNLHFIGPGLRCNPPDNKQQYFFDYFSQAFFNDSSKMNLELYVNLSQNNSEWQFYEGIMHNDLGFLVYSAFSPQLWLFENSAHPDRTHGWYNWNPDFPFACSSYIEPNNSCVEDVTGVQYWIYLADAYLICTASNASFNISFESVNGQQNIIQRNVETLNDWIIVDDIYDTLDTWYLYLFQALGDLIYGNISLSLRNEGELSVGELSYPTNLPPSYSLSVDSQSSVGTTGLVGCDEFLQTPWFTTSMTFSNSTGEILLNPNVSTPGQWDTFTTIPTPYNFGGNPSTCRNGTIAKALQDLAANLTISMLSIPDVTTSTEVLVTIYVPRNIYTYDAKKLLLSYGVTAFFASLAVLIGLRSLHANGVQHSTSFSSFLFTTRNPELDAIAAGQSLGTKPLPREIRRRRLIFGTLDRSGEKDTPEDVRHVAFGFDGAVNRLRKGGVYI